LKILKGEWWEDTSIGLPLYQGILGKIGTTDNISIIDTLVKKQIVDTTDVTGIIEFSSTFNSTTRLYSFTCVVNTKYGAVRVNENL